MILDVNDAPLEYFLEDIFSRCRKEMAKISDKVMSGTLKDFEEYRFYAGKFKGLKESMVIVNEVYKGTPSNIERNIEEHKAHEQQ